MRGDHQHHRRQRDSEASLASGRPSSIGGGGATIDLYKDHHYQSSAISIINSYLFSHTSLSLSLPFPPAKSITQTLVFLLTRLYFPSPKLEDDLPLALQFLYFPFKFNKSTLKSAGTPHQWPNFLAIIHFLVQVAMVEDNRTISSDVNTNPMHGYNSSSYSYYIRGDDEIVEDLERKLKEKLEQEREKVGKRAEELEQNGSEHDSKLETMKAEPSRREVLEKNMKLLEEDAVKFGTVLEMCAEKIAGKEKVLKEKEKELELKEQNRERISEENVGLKKMVEQQTFNAKDVERMRRKLQAVERDIEEAEIARNSWENKSWDLDSSSGYRFIELQALAIECNQANKRLKFGDGFQFAMNAKGSTPAEVMGIDYKSKLKPALASFAEDIKKNSMVNLEELIALQQQLSNIAAKVEGKKNQTETLQSHINVVEAQPNKLKKETEEYTCRCASEAKKMDDLEMEARNLDVVEREQDDILKTSESKLEEAIKQSDAEIYMCGQEPVALVDLVSIFKEFMQSKVLEMKTLVSQTAPAISDAYKASLPAHFGSIFLWKELKKM